MKAKDPKASASVVQLKARLSEYLRRVKAGNEIVVMGRSVNVLGRVRNRSRSCSPSRDQMTSASCRRAARPRDVLREAARKEGFSVLPDNGQ